VPAVAVRRKRQVLFIFNRFKGYLDGIISPNGGEFIFHYTLETGKGESNLLSNN
jgi:hypothetical protein